VESRPLLILGIDPGTTLGYAALDINGNIIEISSSKLLNLNSLISKINNLGTSIIVGCDKKKTLILLENLLLAQVLKQ